MEPAMLLLIALVLILGATLQSAAGFAFGMFAIPLLIVLGRASYEAITIVVICGTFQTVLGLWHLRAHVPWRLIGGMVLITAVTLPAGVWALERVTLLGPARIRQVFGGIVLAAVAAQWLWRVRPREHLHWAWCVLATALGGFLGGFCGMGGPPVVMWIYAHRWTNQRSRVTLWALFTGMMPLQIFFLHRQFGQPVADAAVLGLTYAPVTLVGIIPGFWIGQRLPKPRLRQISYLILVVISLYAIFEPMVRPVA